MDMVEGVARAAYDANSNVPTTDGQWMLDREPWLKIARAAITAMREPTDAMVQAAYDANGYEGGTNWTESRKLDFTAMIDAALAETEGK